jgi:Methyltransferase domain
MPRGAVCAEIGVYKGDFSREILRHAQPRLLHLIDAWWLVEGDFYENPWYAGVGEADTRAAYRQVEALAQDHAECRIHLANDLEILPIFPDAYFDWVYLDSSHEYEHTKQELELLAHKVKGPIAGHDWYPDPTSLHHGVYKAVTEFCDREGWSVTWLDEWAQWMIERE